MRLPSSGEEMQAAPGQVYLAMHLSAMQQCCPGLHGGAAQVAGLIVEGPRGTASWCLQHVYWQELSNLNNLSQDWKCCHSTRSRWAGT